MNITLKIEKEYDVKYLLAECGARYWSDSTVNGEEDTNGKLMPCIDGEYWKPLIELETGKILNWEQGKEADVYYKVCDDGLYKLLDKDKKIIHSIDGYVPKIMCPTKPGYGDYVIMKIDKDGYIKNFNPDFSDFNDED